VSFASFLSAFLVAGQLLRHDKADVHWKNGNGNQNGVEGV
jgi:hypothetical protein